MVVVLPVPLTPTTSTTCGLLRRHRAPAAAPPAAGSPRSPAASRLRTSSVGDLLVEARLGEAWRSAAARRRRRGRRRSAAPPVPRSAASSSRRLVKMPAMPVGQLGRRCAPRPSLAAARTSRAWRAQSVYRSCRQATDQFAVGGARDARRRPMAPAAAASCRRTGAKCSQWPALPSRSSRPARALSARCWSAKNRAERRIARGAQPRRALLAQRPGHLRHARRRRARRAPNRGTRAGR